MAVPRVTVVQVVAPCTRRRICAAVCGVPSTGLWIRASWIGSVASSPSGRTMVGGLGLVCPSTFPE